MSSSGSRTVSFSSAREPGGGVGTGFRSEDMGDDIIPGPYEIGDERPQTYFRTLTQSTTRGLTEDDASSKQRVVRSRGALKWLPTHSFSNDHVYSMWWFVWASFFTTIIPIVPLLALCLGGFWETPADFIPKEEHIGLYAVMIFCGVMWTLASWIFGRACESEPKRPLMASVYCCSSDELLSTWIMFVGMFPTIIIMAVYLHHDPNNIEWKIGFVGAIVCSLLTLVFVYFFLPRKRKSVYINIISPFFTCFCCLCPSFSMRRHVQNDLLVLCWMSVWGCGLCCLVSFILTFWSVYTQNIFEIYEYATFFLNCILFLVGCLYFTAGSYPRDEESLLSTATSSSSNIKTSNPVVEV
jgi:hypothetical protein